QGKVRDYQVYVRYDATINGNGGGGSVNGGADSATVDSATTALVSYDTNTKSQAVNRDYAVPLFGALQADRPFLAADSGFAGQPSDGLVQLDASHRLTTTNQQALNGNVVQTALIDTSRGARFTLALGFGQTQQSAVQASGDSAHTAFAATYQRYVKTWRDYDRGLKPPPGGANQKSIADAYWLSANVVKASEDKTFPGAISASVTSPWGQAVSAGDAPGSAPGYFGSYREVFARDLYEAFTGLLVDGDLATARAATLFLFDRQQQADGSMPRNSLLNGKTAPDTGGTQLDETSYPIIMALQAGLSGNGPLWRDHIRPAADFLVSHGPSFGVERWEEQTGYSPSTIAAEIAGLTAASVIAARHGDPARARVYQATADDFQRNIKSWTVTTTGPDGPGYFIRLSKTGDPNAAITYGLGNGGPTLDQRAVLDGGFQELVRLGELPVSDPDVQASLGVWDRQIAVSMPSGTGFYRYGNSAAAGSADGYGDCYQPSQTSCSPVGAPWPPTGKGTGHLWP